MNNETWREQCDDLLSVTNHQQARITELESKRDALLADLRRLAELWYEWGVLSGRDASEILSKYRTNGESEGK
jgi:hypothetical protein